MLFSVEEVLQERKQLILEMCQMKTLFYGFCLAKINARSETLFMAVGKSLILSVALGLGSWAQVEVRMANDQERKEK